LERVRQLAQGPQARAWPGYSLQRVYGLCFDSSLRECERLFAGSRPRSLCELAHALHGAVASTLCCGLANGFLRALARDPCASWRTRSTEPLLRLEAADWRTASCGLSPATLVRAGARAPRSCCFDSRLRTGRRLLAGSRPRPLCELAHALRGGVCYDRITSFSALAVQCITFPSLPDLFACLRPRLGFWRAASLDFRLDRTL